MGEDYTGAQDRTSVVSEKVAKMSEDGPSTGQEVMALHFAEQHMMRVARLDAAKDARIAELEKACRTALDVYNRHASKKLPGDLVGDLVHARETLRGVLKIKS